MQAVYAAAKQAVFTESVVVEISSRCAKPIGAQDEDYENVQGQKNAVTRPPTGVTFVALPNCQALPTNLSELRR